tara:strand:+ start:2153 stop:2521 length:369 start_codon:yes stop_codon:yes gene_type:complete
MNYLAEKALDVLTDDPEQFMAAMSGSITDSILHPKKLMSCLLKTAVVGFFLAEFVSPAIAQRLELSPKEAVALSFICGYAGIRGLRIAENMVMKKIQPMGGVSDISTPSSKPSEEASTSSAD